MKVVFTRGSSMPAISLMGWEQCISLTQKIINHAMRSMLDSLKTEAPKAVELTFFRTGLTFKGHFMKISQKERDNLKKNQARRMRWLSRIIRWLACANNLNCNFSLKGTIWMAVSRGACSDGMNQQITRLHPLWRIKIHILDNLMIEINLKALVF